MSKAHISLLCLILSTLFIHFSSGDVGTVAHYSPPYIHLSSVYGFASDPREPSLDQLNLVRPGGEVNGKSLPVNVAENRVLTRPTKLSLSYQLNQRLIATACFGGDASKFPSSNMFGAAGEGIWDNGAGCGRQYQVRCISANAPRTCIPGESIEIKIVDRAQSSVSRPSREGTSMVLSTIAFQAIANLSASFINIEFQEV